MKTKHVFMALVLLAATVGGALFYAAFSSAPTDTQETAIATPLISTGSKEKGAQKVSLRALNTGLYDKEVVNVKAGVPVEMTFSADPDSYCGRELLIPAFRVDLKSLQGETQTATFTPTAPGAYEFHCPMKMFRGKLVVEN